MNVQATQKEKAATSAHWKRIYDESFRAMPKRLRTNKRMIRRLRANAKLLVYEFYLTS